MGVEQPFGGVSRTAVGVARLRAAESARPDRLFDDPLAAAFVRAFPRDDRAEPRARPGEPSREALRVHVVMRTRFFDDYLLRACDEGRRQVVLLAAGLDTRAFRLAWPEGTRLFELDLAPVIAFKEAVLAREGAQARCERVALGADLSGDWPSALAGAGFVAAEPAAWLVEGLLVYLDAEAAAGVLRALTASSAAGSTLALERGSGAARASATGDAARGGLRSMWKGGLGGELVASLEAMGWRPEVHSLASVAAAYGRPLAGASASGFVTATYAGGA